MSGYSSPDFSESPHPHEPHAADVYPILADCFTDRRVIVRAWAISALTHFDEPHFQKPIATLLRTAHKDPNKSMQARLRKLASAKRKPARTRSASPSHP